ncbi:GNS1/SUR4 family-domain-containing protein [Lineolata rhizophorae]|uniref:Elongation of fatty acids protein n=1 Tax=Lineolata rhizophorae TaxID=578093 RepID=A0A6A6PDQ8_9PEZI|nr:GNS1/SUR4 family-domain-containing protein [Lineolata rhizophorae]
MSGPTIQLYRPPSSLFKFPPDPAPPALPPPADPLRPLAAPFPIAASTYNAALRVEIPLTVIAVYLVVVRAWNAANRRRGHKPWRASRTRAFFALVIAHNVFLAVYSAATFVAMLAALRATLPGLGLWGPAKVPGTDPIYGAVGTVDALCKMHGPRGLGDAVSFEPEKGRWKSFNRAVRLGTGGTEPDATDVGRLWNEGLSFWGWWFYLSKFYEVVDTAIILAKGKRSSSLQTFHHAGAMLCMWAGIRFMSPPIWMFVFINSGIHALMYTYYTLSALSIRVPQVIKRTLTTMQITQFLVGASFAALHLFVSYTVPVVSARAVIARTFSAAIASASKGLHDHASAAADVLMRLALRAAGEEGLAASMDGVAGAEDALAAAAEAAATAPLPPHVESAAAKVAAAQARAADGEAKYGWAMEPCVTTSGQAFAIWLNLLYLAPLTLLFVRFFVRSYLRRASATSSAAAQPPKGKPKGRRGRRRSRSLSESVARSNVVKAVEDAKKGVDRELESLGRAAEDGVVEVVEKAGTAASRAGGKAKEVVAGPTQEAVKTEEEEDKVNGNAGGAKASKEAAPEVKREQDAEAMVEDDGEDIKQEDQSEERTDSSMAVAAQGGAQEDSEGLSTANPKETGISFADMVNMMKEEE